MKPSTKLSMVACPAVLVVYCAGVWISGWEPARGGDAVLIYLAGLCAVVMGWLFALVELVTEDHAYKRGGGQ